MIFFFFYEVLLFGSETFRPSGETVIHIIPFTECLHGRELYNNFLLCCPVNILEHSPHSVDPSAALWTSNYLHLYCLVNSRCRRDIFVWGHLVQNISTVTAENERNEKPLLVRSEQENAWSVWKTCIRIRSRKWAC